ncbi:MAG: Ni/Fe-hydrogenase, b-type cytochrome subunit [Methanobacteriota archaeon]|nr:MAG: Ni/Fe-hydrogenase, b-type cytochrome subunit [Euryarchaeota archaeon]
MAQLREFVYVWEFPVRMFHWINAFCVITLIITGYLIGNPLAIHSASEASQQYWFGTIRFIHFATAYVWVFIAIVRIYWSFVGNEYARLKNFLPITKEKWSEILRVLRMDVLQIWEGATFSIGHNALAGFVYFIGFLAFLFQIITGFGLYAAMNTNGFADLFAWVVPLMGGDHTVRLWHHLMLWFFVCFFLVHFYLTAYHDYVEATGTISSMVGGWKFIPQTRGDNPGKDTTEKES